MGEATTDFSQYSHGDLKNMVDAMNSGAVMRAADPWRRAYDTLKDIRSALRTYSGQATTDWDGQASDAFAASMAKLADSVNNGAEYANNAAVTLEIVADSIDEAKAAMPDEPSAWDSATDWVGDRVSSMFGADDADTRESEAQSRKQQAVAVLQTLASRYRASVGVLKVPTGGADDKEREWPPPPDLSGAGAIGGVIVGAGLGGIAGASGGGSSSGDSRRSHATAVPSSVGTAAGGTPALTDPAVHGGTATTVTHAPASPVTGAATGIDGSTVGITGGVRTTGVAPGALPGGGAPGASHGIGGGLPVAGGGLTGGVRTAGGLTAGAGRGSAPIEGEAGRTAGGAGGRSRFGAGAGRGGGGGPLDAAALGQGTGRAAGGYGTGGGAGGGLGAGARSTAGRAGGLSRRSGGVVGESMEGGRGGAFTEGGTGIGSRSRVGRSGGSAGGSAGGAGGLGGARGGKREKERRGERPDYLVEDEETWIDGARPNPDVVE
ncbi:WXG100 family type VII secretion target [Streptomyces sp. NPDC092296]|uniref:WXG100 family type VII secretion target n=1 Tax=Streptomyces sp. NPDC092296 TaxID=3366012 RepID=UPI00381EF221